MNKDEDAPMTVLSGYCCLMTSATVPKMSRESAGHWNSFNRDASCADDVV